MEEKEGFFELIKGLDTWQIFTITLIIVLLYFVFKTRLIDKIIKSTTDKNENKLQNEIKRIKDEFAARAFKNIEQAAHHAVESLEHCIGANYYVIHDSGEDLRNVEDWYIVVLRSTSFAVGVDFEKPVKANKTFKWLNSEARDKMFCYLADVEKNPNVEGIDAEYMRTMGIESVAVCIVKNDLNVYHMVSLNFDIKDPKKINPDLRKTLFEFKRSVISNIE